MLRKPILIALAALALTTLACGIQFKSPIIQIKTGPTETTSLDIDLPENLSRTPEITLSFGAGELNLTPGSEKDKIAGIATYNVADFKPRIVNHGSGVRIEQGSLSTQGFPSFNAKIRNDWDLQLPETPLSLRIEAGAYKGNYELGGLSVEDINISDGASDVHLSFSKPNLIEMERLDYITGASNVTLRGLANANFTYMTFRSGVGNYLLDFSGELKRDAEVTIESGISNIELSVPVNTNARLVFEGGLSNIDSDGKWKREGDGYIHSGSGPTLIIVVKMGAGNLELSTDY